MVPSEKGDRNPPEGRGLPYSLTTTAPLTSLSSLATSFRSPRTNSRSSTMILICSFTLVLEAAGGPSAAEDEEGFPLDLADILRWGTSEPGQDRRASRGCCAPGSLALLRPLPPQSPHISAARRAAAGGCAVRSAGRPHCGAAINSPRRGARRRAADGRAARLRLLPPPPAARAHTRGWRGAARRRRGCQLHRPRHIPLGSLPDLFGVMVQGDKFVCFPPFLHPHSKRSLSRQPAAACLLPVCQGPSSLALQQRPGFIHKGPQCDQELESQSVK